MGISNCYDLLMKQNWNENTARQELYRKHLLPSIYIDATGSESSGMQKIARVVKRILSVLCFPLLIFQKPYEFTHHLMGSYLIPAYFKNRNQVLRFVENWDLTTFLMTSLPFSVGLLPTLCQVRPNFFTQWFGARDLKEGKKWQFQRFTVESNQEEKIDAIFIGRKKDQSRWSLPFLTAQNTPFPRRVILYGCSQDELAEGKIHDTELLTLAKKTHSDVLVWNPPGLGFTPGKLSRSSMVKACQEMLRFVENPKGLGAKEVICYGHSLGGAILLEAAKGLSLKARSVFVLRSAFSTLQESVASSVSSWVGSAVRFGGWNFNNTEALQQLKSPAIVLQMAAVDTYEKLIDSSKLISDAVIEDPDATLAKALFAQGPLAPTRKVVGLPLWHDETLSPEHIDALAKDIEGFLA